MREQLHRSVVCEWIDSCEPGDNADVLAEEFPEPQVITSLGWLARSEPDYIVVCGAIKRDCNVGTTYDYVITIPRVSIIRLEDMVVKEVE